jgi:putative hydrolase of the HAD superfamily
MTIRAVFFDLDDTLIDTIGGRFARAKLSAARIVRDYPHLTMESLYERFLAPGPFGHDWPLGVVPVLQELKLHETRAGLEAIGLWFNIGCEHLVTPIAGVIEAIACLDARIIRGVITNGDDHIQRNKFRQLGLDERVSVFVTNQRAGFSKPDPRIYELALAEAGVAPHEAVFIGDIVDVDVAGALAAGMHAIHFDRGVVDTKSVDPARYHRIESYGELAVILETIDAANLRNEAIIEP